MLFILWNPKPDQENPVYGADGKISSDGVIGRVGVDNVYLKTYGQYPDDRRPGALKVGECIKGVVYTLSGQKGTYDIYRVE